MSEAIKQVQRALKSARFNPGEIDGIMGRKTYDAVRRFQLMNDLEPDGIVGPLTRAKLFANKPPVEVVNMDPPWLTEMKRLSGTLETPGPQNNPMIIGWAKAIGGWTGKFYTKDSIPWCGLTIAHVIGVTLPNEPLPANVLGALQWNKFGVEMKEPTTGAIMTFKRDGGGHVGLYDSEDDKNYYIWGGNQSDQVNLTKLPKSRLVTFRWPSTYTAPTTGRIVRRGSHIPTSKSEA